MAEREGPRDEELMRQVADGRAEALGALYERYARLVLGLAARSLDRAHAEEVVQEVFLTVWRKASMFDAGRGSFRAWLLQMAHFRILNELRHERRQPPLAPDPDGVLTEQLTDGGPEPAEAVWRARRGAILRSAFEELPAAQRDALGLAVFQDLTHEEVAARLGLPLGTAKTRIRTGLLRLRGRLAPLAASLGLLIVIGVLGAAYHAERVRLARDERALALVTASDSVNLRLGPQAGVPADTHARYRGRPGAPLAVVTLSSFPSPSARETYQVWVRHGGAWTSIGTVRPDTTGAARLIAEAAILETLPEAVEITREPAGGSSAPTGPAMVAWAASP